MSQELVNNGCMTTPEIKAKQEKQYVWEEVSPEMDTETEIPWEYKVKGDELIGDYLCKKENMGIFNQNIYVILDNNNERKSVFGCTVLDKLFEKVQVNDFVKIVFMGNKPSGYGNYYKDFKLFKRRQ